MAKHDPYGVCDRAKNPKECKRLMKQLLDNVDDLTDEQQSSILKRLTQITDYSGARLGAEILGKDCGCG